MEPTTNSAQNTSNPTPVHSPLLLLNNMANLMSTKLDSTNYMIWKLQISAILDAYSMIDHLDGSNPPPCLCLFTDAGTQSANPAFLMWKKRDKALLTLLYSTLSSPIIAMVVGLSTSLEVWNTLEERFTSTARINVLNLKMELQSIRKGNETITTYLLRVKTVRDKLSAVGVHTDHEELFHVILKGLPKEYAPFASAIKTRDGFLSLEKLSVLLQTEEQSMQEASNPLINSALAMFVSHNKPSNNYNGNQGYTREIPSQEVEEEEEDLLQTTLLTSIHHCLILNSNPHLLLQSNLTGLHAKSVGSKAIMLLIATTEWILLTKAKIQQPSLLQWPVLPTFTIFRQLRLGSQILVHLTTSQPLPTT